jgi:hypothetical protein
MRFKYMFIDHSYYICICPAYVEHIQQWLPPVLDINSIKAPSIPASVTWGHHSSFKSTIGHILVSYINQEHFYFYKHYFKLIFNATYVDISLIYSTRGSN